MDGSFLAQPHETVSNPRLKAQNVQSSALFDANCA